ncbi:MAG: FkbM family methyltransferase, partial [Alphaproteobacteria bacterium]|nr:FkbM family methyltransferase [Alphaproteobacteria bacterium]
MQLFFASFFARLSRLFPKQRSFRVGGMSARFFVPFFNHYVTSDLIEIKARAREPYLYQWLDGLEDGAVLFDVGTSYGQESVLASSKDITVVGFDCSLVGAHLCALNKRLNDDRFRLVVAAVAETSGQMITITTNSDTHIPSLHKKNVPYSYEVSTLALDDFARANALAPTHLKIDVDGAEMGVLKGAASLL